MRKLAAKNGIDTLADRVHSTLRAALTAGDMEPGQTYSVPSLAKRFDVSPTPVREAMLRLAKEGFVEPIKNKGFRVVEIRQEQLDQIIELRLLLEVPATVKAARLVTPSQMTRLRDLAARIVSHAKDGNLTLYIKADTEFHQLLMQIAGNPQLTKLTEVLRAQTRLLGLSHLAKTGSLVDSANEHLQLLDKIERGDAGSVQKLISHHLGHARGIWSGREE